MRQIILSCNAAFSPKGCQSRTANRRYKKQAKTVYGCKDRGAEVSVFGPDDFTKDMVSEFDAIAFGCPAMGAEVLEESSFDPMFTAVEGSLSGKKIALFPSS